MSKDIKSGGLPYSRVIQYEFLFFCHFNLLKRIFLDLELEKKQMYVLVLPS